MIIDWIRLAHRVYYVLTEIIVPIVDIEPGHGGHWRAT